MQKNVNFVNSSFLWTLLICSESLKCALPAPNEYRCKLEGVKNQLAPLHIKKRVKI